MCNIVDVEVEGQIPKPTGDMFEIINKARNIINSEGGEYDVLTLTESDEITLAIGFIMGANWNNENLKGEVRCLTRSLMRR